MCARAVYSQAAPSNREGGAALIVFMTIVVLIVAAALLSRLNAGAVRREFDDQTMRALAQAKEALIAFAVRYPDDYPGEGPGYLPCPDINNLGVGEASCGSIGGIEVRRLPWRQLGLPDLRDGSGERLWYAVGSHKYNPKTSPLNSDTPGNLTVDGADDLVAVVIAPGPALSSQGNRESVLVTDYLEGENADGDGDFASGAASATFNDRVLTVTRDELMRAVEERVLGELVQTLKRYREDHGNAYFPALIPLTPVAGTAEIGTTTVTLRDTSRDFLAAGVAPGDVLFRTAPTVSHSPIDVVTANTLHVTSVTIGLAAGDVYEVRKREGRFPDVIDLAAARDIPAWFFAQGWDLLTYVAVSIEDVEGGIGCLTGSTCLTLYNAPGAANDKKVVALTAGRALADLPPASYDQSRLSSNLADLFEATTVGGSAISNSDGDGVFVNGPSSSSFNDQARAVPP